MGTEHPRLEEVERVDLPVVEASGLATKFIGGRAHVIVVGDRTSEVGIGAITPAGESPEWRTIDLATAPGWPLPARDSQLEAVAVDGGSLVALLQEEPPVVLVADTERRSLVANISLRAPRGSPLAGRWDDPSSRGEGLVFLRGGRLLVAKEKRPRALVEFAPRGVGARGVSRDDLLDADESWQAPSGEVDFDAVAMWRLRGQAKKELGDISALAVGRDRSLWLLSDKSRCVARLSLERALRPSHDEIRDLDEIWRLPKGTTKPEGIAAIADDRVLVAMDTGSTHRNGVVVRRPSA